MIQKSIRDGWSHHNCGFIISAVIRVSSQCHIMFLTWHVKNPLSSSICSCHWWLFGFESHVTLGPDPPHSMCTSACNKLQVHNCHLESWGTQTLWTFFTFLNFPGHINEIWKHNQLTKTTATSWNWFRIQRIHIPMIPFYNITIINKYNIAFKLIKVDSLKLHIISYNICHISFCTCAILCHICL